MRTLGLILLWQLTLSCAAWGQRPAGETWVDGQEEITEEVRQAKDLRASGRFAAAALHAERAVDLAIALDGEASERGVETMQLLASLHEDRRQDERALSIRQRVLRVVKALRGEGHWLVGEERFRIRSLELRLSVPDKDRLATADKLDSQFQEMLSLRAPGSFPRTLEIGERAVAAHSAAAIDRTAGYLSLLDQMAQMHSHTDRERAIELCDEYLSICGDLVGDDQPLYAVGLRSRARLAQLGGKDAEAELLYKRALRILEGCSGKEREYLHCMSELARHHESNNDGEGATVLFRDAVELATKLFGPSDQLVAYRRALARAYAAMQQYSGAATVHEETLEILGQLYGARHPELVVVLDELAQYHQSAANWSRSEECFRIAAEIQRESKGEHSLEFAACLQSWATLYMHKEPERATQMELQAGAIIEAAVGTQSPRYAVSMKNLGAFALGSRQFSQAESCYREALSIERDLVGLASPKQYQVAVYEVCQMFKSVGEYTRAERFVTDFYLPALGSTVSSTSAAHVGALMLLSELASARWNFELAESRLREALELVRSGTAPIDQANVPAMLVNLGQLCCDFGDHRAAIRYLTEARELAGAQLESLDADTSSQRRALLIDINASVLNNLGNAFVNTGDPEEGADALRESLQYRGEALVLWESQHADEVAAARAELGKTTSNLGVALLQIGAYDRAASLLEGALETQRRWYGPRSLELAASLGRLAYARCRTGEFESAERLAREAVSIVEETTQQWSVSALDTGGHYVLALSQLVSVLLADEEYEAAESLARRALEVSEERFLNSTLSLSERQQFALKPELSVHLDHWLCAAPHAGIDAQSQYRSVLAWKGLISRRQRILRQLITQDDETARLFEALRAVTAKLSGLTVAGTSSGEVAALTDRKESLERALIARGIELGPEHRETALEQIRLRLPANTAFIDFLFYVRTALDRDRGLLETEVHAMAFIITPARVVRVELGPAGALTAAVTVWRSLATQGASVEKAAMNLRGLVWNPLAQYLDGASQVLYSPDGSLCYFPLAALPGHEPNTYLIEELAIAATTVEGLLFDSKQDSSSSLSAILVGDVNYDVADRSASPEHGGAFRSAAISSMSAMPGAVTHFSELPGTVAELKEIEDSFEKAFAEHRPEVLRGKRATEQRFREQTQGKNFVHVASHGFFDLSTLSSASTSLTMNLEHLAGFTLTPRRATAFNPDLATGLVLAGANRRVEAGTSDGANDGILTALEVGTLDLSCAELVVLSACETAMGESNTGEGLQGLQRAFHIAGARTVVSSLWSVDDRVTRDLMRAFYENLLQRGMTKLEALRQAQIAILNDSRDGTRGRGRPTVRRVVETDPAARRLHPRFWAAWVLSGDTQRIPGVLAANRVTKQDSLTRDDHRGSAFPFWIATLAATLVLVAATMVCLRFASED